MIIHWNENPLETRIELAANDIEKLRLRLQIEEMEDRIYGAYVKLEKPEKYDTSAVLSALNVDGLEEEPFKKRLDWLQEIYVDSLSNVHCGDCTCVPASCTKCHAEELLGINTIEGAGKHSLNKIGNAFSKGKTLDEVIAYLADYTVERTGEWLNHPEEDFQRHVPRWINEAKHAHDWLLGYKEKISFGCYYQ